MSSNMAQPHMMKVIKEQKQCIRYAERYRDDKYEYRHVILPKPIADLIPKGKLMSEPEWRSYGIQQSPGWLHYMIHAPEPHVLLFRREYAQE